MTTLHAGVSRGKITPPPGIYLTGYGFGLRPNLGAHDDLYVTTLVLDDGSARAVILTADHLFIHPVFIEQVKTRLQSAAGVAPEAVFVCCSHTHSGPIGYASDGSRPEDRAYTAFLVEQLVQSGSEAAKQLQPVSLRMGRDDAHININRRERKPDGTIIIGSNPAGAVDHSVQVIQAVTAHNAPLATLVNYACHPVVMGPQNQQVSADWVGVMRQAVEAEIGGLCLFVQGATGDVNPRHMRWTADNWDEIDSQGREVAAAVIRAGAQMTPLDGAPIRAEQSAQWLRLNPPGKFDERVFIPQAQTVEEARAVIREMLPWHTDLQILSEGVHSPVNIGALRVGEWALAALGTEPFTETGWAIKAASPYKMTFVAGYTNGCNSYLPVESAYADGGYEVETAPLFYGLPAGFEPGSAEHITSRIAELLKSIG